MSEWLWPLALALVRVWSLLRVQASWRALLGRLWEPIAAALALSVAAAMLLAGRLAWAPTPEHWIAAVELLALEFLLGGVIGQLAALPGWALVGAAQTSEQALGYVDEPDRPGSLRALIVALALASGLGLGLHRPLIAGLWRTVERLPLGEPLAWLPELERVAVELPTMLVELTTLALALATPVLLVHAVVTISIGSLARGPDPAEALLASVVPGLRFAAALLALGASWSVYGDAWARGLG